MIDPDVSSAYWSKETSALAASLDSGPQGLTSQQAASRLLRGANILEDSPRLSDLRLFLRQFESPLVLILVFAALISIALREWVDASIILAIVLGSSFLSFFQEHRASHAIEELKRRLALKARVLRDGAECLLPTSAIVSGDVILLAAGNLIPADGVVLEAADFLVTEASITGESFPVEKRPGAVAAGAPLTARSNTVFLGASVRSGTAKVLIVNTGRQTEFGTIASRLKAVPPESDFSRGVRHFGYLLVRVMVVIIVFVLTVNLALQRPVIESLLFAVALAVGLSPELLPAIITVTLSAGARAMSRRGVIIRRLEAIENLGSMDVLCTDKTGTLTTGTIELQDTLDVDQRSLPELRRLAFFNAAFETGIDNPLDACLVSAGKAAGLTTDGVSKIDEIPYDFVRRRLTIVVAEARSPDQHLIITKGAFANVLGICTSVERQGGTFPLDEPLRNEFEAAFREKSMEGYRVLALATRAVGAKAQYGRDDESEMTFRGFLIFHDPPKAQVADTLRELAARGIGIKVISGDNRYVTAHLAKAVGLDSSSILTGEELAGLKDESLWHLAPRTSLFVEIDPQQKERIVHALQRTGHAVGFLGDGINDAPALHAADVGISVDQAVDVARESAEVILLRPDLDVLCAGIEVGRRTFANTLKYISITTSANFGNMVSMALAAPLLPFLPLAAKQILLNNFLSDLPSIAISTDNVDADLMTQPRHWSIADIQKFMIMFGLISSAFDLLTFGVLLVVFRADETTFHTAWFLISVLTELAVVLVLRTHLPVLRGRPSRLLLGSTIAVFAAVLAIPYLKPAQKLFDFVALSWPLMATSLIIVSAYVVTTELAKRRFLRHGTPGATPAVNMNEKT